MTAQQRLIDKAKKVLRTQGYEPEEVRDIEMSRESFKDILRDIQTEMYKDGFEVTQQTIREDILSGKHVHGISDGVRFKHDGKTYYALDSSGMPITIHPAT